MTFLLPVMDEKVKPHQVTGLHLLSAFVIAGIGAFFYLLYADVKWAGLAMMIAGLVLLFISLFKIKWITQGINNRLFRVFELAALLSTAIYLALHHRWIPTIVPGSLSLALLFALYWERGAYKNLTIQVSKEGIKLPVTSRKRQVHWHEVEQVLLRYGILTIDCHNNRLFQYHVEPAGVDKEAFENYCSDNVTANIDKREKDW